MDKISEILNSVKDRLSNPLIFSFLVSWLVYNWRIPVALIWFDEKQISANGCKSIFEFIENEWSMNGYFWIPLFIAIGYTFGFPIIKNLISATQTWMAKWGEDLNLYLSKEGKVSIDKYLSLRIEFKSKINELENIISEEDELRVRNNQLLESNLKLQKENENIYLQASESINYSMLNGVWKRIDGLILKSPSNVTINVLRFHEGSCYINNESDRAFYVSNFITDWKRNYMYFLLRIDKDNSKFYYFDLRYDEKIDTLDGTVNLYKVKLEKQKI